MAGCCFVLPAAGSYLLMYYKDICFLQVLSDLVGVNLILLLRPFTHVGTEAGSIPGDRGRLVMTQ